MSYTPYSVCLAELMRGCGIDTPTHGYKPEQAFSDGRKLLDRITELEAQPLQPITELEAQAETQPLRVRAKSYKPQMAYGATDVINDLKAQLEAAKKDAERYQWLRDSAPNLPSSSGNAPGVLMTTSRGYAVLDSDNFPSWLDGEGLDAAIDAAIQAEGKA